MICWTVKIRGTFYTSLFEIINGKQDGEDCGVIVVLCCVYVCVFLKFTWLPVWYIRSLLGRKDKRDTVGVCSERLWAEVLRQSLYPKMR